jgi:hypothetical protein
LESRYLALLCSRCVISLPHTDCAPASPMR